MFRKGELGLGLRNMHPTLLYTSRIPSAFLYCPVSAVPLHSPHQEGDHIHSENFYFMTQWSQGIDDMTLRGAVMVVMMTGSYGEDDGADGSHCDGGDNGGGGGGGGDDDGRDGTDGSHCDGDDDDGGDNGGWW